MSDGDVFLWILITIFIFIVLIIIFVALTSSNSQTQPTEDEICFQEDNPSPPICKQLNIASPTYWNYHWTNSSDDVGVLQIYNAGTQTMWVRYGGTTINDPSSNLSWMKYITTPSELNGMNAHQFTPSSKLPGQGDAFRLAPLEYQILPFVGKSAWFGISLGCCSDGSQCTVNPFGRGGYPATLFEWTVPGVQDISIVDGFNVSMKIETLGSDTPLVAFNANQSLCKNQLINNDGVYLGCLSMCACQEGADSSGINPICEGMTNIHSTSPNNMPASNGYCGCAGPTGVPFPACQPEPDASHKLYGSLPQYVAGADPAGLAFCNAITEMSNIGGVRQVYCQSYDDAHGTRSLGSGIIKITVNNTDYENVAEKSCGAPPIPSSCQENTDPDSTWNAVTTGDITCGQRYTYVKNQGTSADPWKTVVCDSPNTDANTICEPCYTGPCSSSTIPNCSTVLHKQDQCPSGSPTNPVYVSYQDPDGNPNSWGCRIGSPFPTGTQQCIKE